MSSRSQPLRRPTQPIQELRRALDAAAKKERARAAQEIWEGRALAAREARKAREESEAREARESAAREARVDAALAAVANQPAERLEDLPLHLRQLVARGIIADEAGDALTLCARVSAWCEAHPISCTKDGAFWREAFVAAFGTLHAMPDAFTEVTWKNLFAYVCDALNALPPEMQKEWANMASWTEIKLDKWAYAIMSQPVTELNPLLMITRPKDDRSYMDVLFVLLTARGASVARHHNRVTRNNRMVRAWSNPDVAVVSEFVAAELAAGADPNASESVDGATVLMQACVHGDLDTVRVLLRAGADPNVTRGSPGITALKFAVTDGRTDIVAALREAGAKEEWWHLQGRPY